MRRLTVFFLSQHGLTINSDFYGVDSEFKGTLEEAPKDGNLRPPRQFFQEIITDSMFVMINTETVWYSTQYTNVEVY